MYFFWVCGLKNAEDLISKACHTEFSRFRGLRQDLETKFAVIFHNYGLELTHVQDQYEKYKTGMAYKSPNSHIGKGEI